MPPYDDVGVELFSFHKWLALDKTLCEGLVLNEVLVSTMTVEEFIEQRSCVVTRYHCCGCSQAHVLVVVDQLANLFA